MINKSKKIEEGKLEKKKKIMDAGFSLFTNKGFKDTSIQEIVDEASVAKGTFYLYFKDKYDLEEHIIINKSKQLFTDAIVSLKQKNIKKLDRQIIYIIDYVIDQLSNKPILLKLIGKNVSLGVFSQKLTKLLESDDLNIYELFLKGCSDNNIKLKNPEVTLFMIIELVSSTCYTSIVKRMPISINEFKPYLYQEISNMINAK